MDAVTHFDTPGTIPKPGQITAAACQR